jgi:Pyruvate/2-oxoacid:ferredoxin oxidoreductase gamma subunit
VYQPDAVVSFAWTATPWDQISSAAHRPILCLANLPAGQSKRFLKLGLQGGYLDADELTHEMLGRGTPPNAAMLGAFSAVTGWVSIEAVVEAILASWPAEMGERNALTARRAYATVSKVGRTQ